MLKIQTFAVQFGIESFMEGVESVTRPRFRADAGPPTERKYSAWSQSDKQLLKLERRSFDDYPPLLRFFREL